MAAIPEVQSRLGFFYHRSRISWSAIFGGMFVGLAVFVLAALLGMAIRFSVYTPSSGNVAPSFGTGSTIWLIVSWIVAIFVGAMVAGELLQRDSLRSEGILHGVVVWGFASIVLLWLIGQGAGAVFGVAGAVASNPALAEQAAQMQGQAQATLQTTATEVQNTAVYFGWGGFIAMILALGAAILGGMAGIPGERRPAELRGPEYGRGGEPVPHPA